MLAKSDSIKRRALLNRFTFDKYKKNIFEHKISGHHPRIGGD
jgi:hypothetical protein